MLEILQASYGDTIFFAADDPRAIEEKNLASRHPNLKYAKNFAEAFAMATAIWPKMPPYRLWFCSRNGKGAGFN